MQFRTRMSTRLAIVAAAVAIGTTGWLTPTPAAAAGIEIRMQDNAPAGTPQARFVALRDNLPPGAAEAAKAKAKAAAPAKS
jgi:hypothetical protein